MWRSRSLNLRGWQSTKKLIAIAAFATTLAPASALKLAPSPTLDAVKARDIAARAFAARDTGCQRLLAHLRSLAGVVVL